MKDYKTYKLKKEDFDANGWLQIYKIDNLLFEKDSPSKDDWIVYKVVKSTKKERKIRETPIAYLIVGDEVLILRQQEFPKKPTKRSTANVFN